MLRVAMHTTIETLWKRGISKSEIARLTGHDWKTVAKVIKGLQSGQSIAERKPHPQLLDEYKASILAWLETGLNGIRIHEELQAQGKSVSYSTVKAFIATIKKREVLFCTNMEPF